jgi:uncharacterized protein related to proFAR isomerase
MTGLPTTVEPSRHRLTVRGTVIELTAMGGKEAIDWAELQVACGATKVEAMELAKLGRDADLRRSLELLFAADLDLVERAGVPRDLANLLSQEEKRTIVDTQDALNRMDLAAPWLALQHQAAKAHLSVE